MKIKDLISLEKRNSKGEKSNSTNYFRHWENETQLRYEEKNGYYWKIPSHSQEESILLNNYEKDCVVAYVENPYMIVFLIKIRGKDNYKAFIYSKNVLRNVSDYIINKVYDKNALIKTFDLDIENVKIIDDIEYQRFKKLLLLEAIEKGN